MRIGTHDIGRGCPVFVVAELSCNHLGSYERALRLVAAARLAGANAVKLQHDDPDGGITIDCDNEWFRIKDGPWAGQTLYQLYKQTFTRWDWFDKLSSIAYLFGMECFSTPSCVAGVEYLYNHGTPCFKVSSFEACDVRLLVAIDATDKPVMVSLGCSDAADLEYIRRVFPMDRCIPMHCVSEYPADPRGAGMVRIKELQKLGWSNVGFSDHSGDTVLPALAVALGACVIEKHLTLRRADGGPDAGFSLEPEEFAHMVTQVRLAERAMVPQQKPVDRTFCKSVFAVADIKAGERFTDRNIGIIRPGYGLHPREYRRVLGCVAKADIPRGTPITEAML
jgi:pseudaminic acid synthase